MKTKREWTKDELDKVWPLPEGWVWARDMSLLAFAGLGFFVAERVRDVVRRRALYKKFSLALSEAREEGES